MTPEQEILRGQQAKRVLDDAIYNEAFDSIKARIDSLVYSTDTPPDRRQRMADLGAALISVRRYMEQVVSGGKVAAEQIERDKKFSERVRDRVRQVV